ncbi:GNAT family N-acetyltransferase [Allopseudospirillum japonicum]|nr:GNAT family N-acetyltransferase [Allopseudospirillum japonicum]
MAQVKVVAGTWSQYQKYCTAIRHQVFVQEQKVPPELELDALDPHCEHYLLLVNQKPVGTARISKEGKLGRLALLKPVRGHGLGRKLMQFIVARARQRGWPKITLAAQTTSLGFYQQLGFGIASETYIDAGLPHQDMVMTLAAQDQQAPEQISVAYLQTYLEQDRSGQWIVHGRQEMQIAWHALTQAAKQKIKIYAPELYLAWFDDEVMSQFTRVCRAHKYNQIQILVSQTRSLTQRTNKLVRLQQRLSSGLQIQQTHPSYRPQREAYLLVDDTHVLYLADTDAHKATLEIGRSRLALAKAAEFKSYWERAQQIKELQKTGL